MVMQGRIISSALKDSEDLEEGANSIVKNLNRAVTARIRVIDNGGSVLADSSSSIQDMESDESVRKYSSIEVSTDDNILYSLVRLGLGVVRYIFNGPSLISSSYEYYRSNSYLDGIEVKMALNGEYGATIRVSPGAERSITMYSALPIYNRDSIDGVVLISKSTYGILQDLYQIRLEILKIFLLSLLFAAILSIILSKTIGGPLKKLRLQAKEIIDHKGRLLTHFKYSKRQDEIGDLSLSLEVLTKKLKEYLNGTEQFATDISHEFKNPLASIKTATDILKQGECSDDERHFIGIIDDEVDRLNRLITEVREISLIDNRDVVELEESINLNSTIDGILKIFQLRYSDINFVFNSDSVIHYRISETRFTQIVENILSNGVSFSPKKSIVEITLTGSVHSVVITISNQGPKIPKEHMDRIFNRFFTYREGESGRNSGLGLSICDAIVQSYGGHLSVVNREPTGCEFSIVLPRR